MDPQKRKAYIDWYAPPNPWYFVVQVCIYVFAAGLIADLVQVMNLSVPYADRFKSLHWVLLMLSTVKYLMPIFVMLAILFRRQLGCSIFWFILILMVWVVSVFVVIGWGRYYGAANRRGEKGNPFNSNLWCCVPEIYTIDAHECPNTNRACIPSPQGDGYTTLPVTLGDLSVSRDYAARFWVDFVYMLYHTAIVAFFAWTLSSGMPFFSPKKRFTLSGSSIAATKVTKIVDSKMTKDD